jgi:hypothetical protein
MQKYTVHAGTSVHVSEESERTRKSIANDHRSGIRKFVPWNHRIIVGFSGFQGLLPTSCAKAPFAARLETDAAQVVAAGGAKV